MKLGKTALLEIVQIVLEGLANNTDISDKLRQLDLVEDTSTQNPGLLELSSEYVSGATKSTKLENN